MQNTAALHTAVFFFLDICAEPGGCPITVLPQFGLGKLLFIETDAISETHLTVKVNLILAQNSLS